MFGIRVCLEGMPSQEECEGDAIAVGVRDVVPLGSVPNPIAEPVPERRE